MLFAVGADYLFDGRKLCPDVAVVIDGPVIRQVMSRAELPACIAVRHLRKGAWLVPGFIDLQVNGGGDVLFNDDPSPQAILAIAAAHRRFGTTALLPTMLSDTPEKMRAARRAVDAAAELDPSIIGVHYEGPFLSPERPGVHDRAMIRGPGAEDLEFLTTPGKGATLVTLAPEEVPPGFIAQLAAAGVRVSLGHSMASYAQTRAALAEGLTGFTHLFNAMRPLASREPGPIAAALEEPGAYLGLIVDGEHVAPAMLRLVLRNAGRPMLVTDAMPPVGGRLTSFRLCGHEIMVSRGRCTTAEGTLAGSALDMASAVRNCVQLLGLSLEQALPLACASPAAFLGLDSWLGQLARGYRADMVALDPETVRVFETWIAGASSVTA
jgi:N-acetylglucosamine-6-phosphate deacetylase